MTSHEALEDQAEHDTFKTAPVQKENTLVYGKHQFSWDITFSSVDTYRLGTLRNPCPQFPLFPRPCSNNHKLPHSTPARNTAKTSEHASATKCGITHSHTSVTNLLSHTHGANNTHARDPVNQAFVQTRNSRSKDVQKETSNITIMENTQQSHRTHDHPPTMQSINPNNQPIIIHLPSPLPSRPVLLTHNCPPGQALGERNP